MKYLVIPLILISVFKGFSQELIDSGFAKKINAKNVIKDNKKEGIWIEYLDSNENTVKDTADASYYRIVNYKEGRPIGIVTEYYLNGKLYSEIPFTNGQKNGICKYYYESGALMILDPFTNGEENGVEKMYWENGKLRSETRFKHGDWGKTTTFDKEGHKISSGRD